MLHARLRGLRMLARQTALTPEDWFKLLQERRVLLGPHLEAMTLKTLGDLEIVRDYQGGHGSQRPLRMGAMRASSWTDPIHNHRSASELQIAEGPYRLDTRGIFPDDSVYHGHYKTEFVRRDGKSSAIGHITRFWGLTRNNEWLMAVCEERYFDQVRSPDHDLRYEQRSEVIKFITFKSTPEEISAVYGSPQRIWQGLGDAAKQWLKHRQSLLDAAESLVRLIDQEEELVKLVSS